MDLSELSNFYQPCTSQQVVATNVENNDSMISSYQTTVPSANKMLLKVLSPSEDTIKNCLNSDQDTNNDNNNNDCVQFINSSNTVNMDVDKFYLKNICRFGSKRSEIDYFNSYDMASDSIYSDSLDKVVFNIVCQNNLNLADLDLDGYGNTETYYQYYDEHHNDALQSNVKFTYNDYVKLRANNLLLTRLGYKLTIKLNTDNDKVPETWNPNVAQKILSVDYSPVSLVKDCIPAQTPFDQLQYLLLSEVVNAFQDDEPVKLPDFSLKFRTDPSPVKFVSICRKLKTFNQLCNEDKILLFSSSFYDVFCTKAVFKYNQASDEWILPDYNSRFSRRDLFIWNPILYYETIPAIETFPDRWRKDEVVEALISLIVIFNPDQVGLNSADSVRHEQYGYIYLLKRYLESVCESPCDASENHYRLMVCVEKFREIGEIACQHINEIVPGYHRSLRNLIIDVIMNK